MSKIDPSELPKYSPPALIAKMRECVDYIDKTVKNTENHKIPVQLDDLRTWCWAMIDLCILLDKRVNNDLEPLIPEEDL